MIRRTLNWSPCFCSLVPTTQVASLALFKYETRLPYSPAQKHGSTMRVQVPGVTSIARVYSSTSLGMASHTCFRRIVSPYPGTHVCSHSPQPLTHYFWHIPSTLLLQASYPLCSIYLYHLINEAVSNHFK